MTAERNRQVPENEKKTVFAISQIGSEGSPERKRANIIFEHIISPVVKEFDMRPDRSDRDPTPGPVTSRILRSILDSAIVVADLTGRNPNVYYELCFAHSFGKPVVILVDKASSLSFDVKNERVIELHDEGQIGIEQGENVKKKLRSAFEIVLREGYEPSSLVTEVAGTQDIERLTPDNPIVSELASLRTLMERTNSRIGRMSSSHEPHDIRVLTRFIRGLAEEGRVTKSDIADLVDGETSTAFDNWAERIAETAPSSQEQDENFDDIPF